MNASVVPMIGSVLPWNDSSPTFSCGLVVPRPWAIVAVAAAAAARVADEADRAQMQLDQSNAGMQVGGQRNKSYALVRRISRQDVGIQRNKKSAARWMKRMVQRDKTAPFHGRSEQYTGARCQPRSHTTCFRICAQMSMASATAHQVPYRQGCMPALPDLGLHRQAHVPAGRYNEHGAPCSIIAYWGRWVCTSPIADRIAAVTCHRTQFPRCFCAFRQIPLVVIETVSWKAWCKRQGATVGSRFLFHQFFSG